MARFVGTGKAPHGYAEGQVFDVPDDDEGTQEDLIRRGWAYAQAPEDDIGRTPVSIADAMVRGDLLNNPDDAAVAATIDDPWAVVHNVDPDATQEDYENEVAHRSNFNAVGQRVAVPEETKRGKKKAAAKAKAAAKPAAEADTEPAADAADDKKPSAKKS